MITQEQNERMLYTALAYFNEKIDRAAPIIKALEGTGIPVYIPQEWLPQINTYVGELPEGATNLDYNYPNRNPFICLQYFSEIPTQEEIDKLQRWMEIQTTKYPYLTTTNPEYPYINPSNPDGPRSLIQIDYDTVILRKNAGDWTYHRISWEHTGYKKGSLDELLETAKLPTEPQPDTQF